MKTAIKAKWIAHGRRTRPWLPMAAPSPREPRFSRETYGVARSAWSQAGCRIGNGRWVRLAWVGVTKGPLLFGRRRTRWAIVAAFAFAVAWPVATVDAATTRECSRAREATRRLAQDNDPGGLASRRGVPRCGCLHVRDQEDRRRNRVPAGRLWNELRELL